MKIDETSVWVQIVKGVLLAIILLFVLGVIAGVRISW